MSEPSNFTVVDAQQQDLAIMFGFWGVASAADLNNDGITSGPDLARLLTNWGSCGQ